ncbi:SANT associated domain-containing protein [Strongyloides ratti]|uniref:SANT associated domain-containing protein n=1 Tax=Strongyloides ratti TaxID=34506 RepID=A0A090LLC2_STRRB|nr:SANT associated domain-containing protein [Strongyloides ratti]CEF68973.1 SANT associated domain-containing protein [Strongyloides ratti]
MDIYDDLDFVYLSNWVIKFSEEEHGDFDIVLEGVIGKNSLSLIEKNYYRTDSVIKILEHNIIICERNVKIFLTSQINEQDMLDMGFTKEYVSCFKYGFPTNWIDLIEFIYDRIKNEDYLPLPNELLKVAIDNMKEYEPYDFNAVITLVDWDVELSFCGENDFNVILKGTIKDCDSNIKNIEVSINDRESINLVSCINRKLYKLESKINFYRMRENGYTLEFIECFKYGFPSNWIELFDELYNQYKMSVRNVIIPRNLINDATDEMEDFELLQKSLSQKFQDVSMELSEDEDIKHLHILETKSENALENFSPSSSKVSTFNLLDKQNSHLYSEVNVSSDKHDSIHSLLKIPIVISTPKVGNQEKLVSNSLPSINLSPILSVSSNKNIKQQCESEEVITPAISLCESGNNSTQPTTDFFALSHDHDPVSEVRKRRVGKSVKRKIQSSPEGTPTKIDTTKKIKKKFSKKKPFKKISKLSMSIENEDVIDDINNTTNFQKLFDASLDLGDLENISRGRFSFTDDSVLGISMSDDIFKKPDNRNKNIVFYLPTGKHVSKKKTKKKVSEKKASEDNPFDFEKLVYEEIEKNQAFELEDYEELEET